MDVLSYARYLARRAVRGSYGSMVGREFQAPDWDIYRMDVKRPFEAIEHPEREIRMVDSALHALQQAGIIGDTRYDHAGYAAMREAVKREFDIPWTAISPRVQRLIYAINAIHRPAVMIAAGVFCGNTFISNAGAAVGPGAGYAARALIGIEIDPEEAQRAERNVRRIDRTQVARIVADDAVEFCATWSDRIDLLYLDADGDRGRGKSIYREILDTAWDKLPAGALMLAHNSVNSATAMRDYLEFVRNPANCGASINLVLDWEGLEVSRK
ncbi:MAG: putative O-methyltransferase [Candidatus Accumulibacter appositus]|uniref:Putative O-methyltransferase n=1 Tax=Candidatus Accumulibacter appositus TaxID=1454003 RepID=A0A011PPR5_9PROT|nr:class I SAM-dependent methyltransferase [Accumulibacter sp.]EXI78870.1 MAG: putative O-methyltransferase [Candidatus Accumulibacter appositus]HRF05545.1 class I SAM-dependent methyltransferase [Accumulibacter sp.]